MTASRDLRKSGLAFDLEYRQDRHAEPPLELVIASKNASRVDARAGARASILAGPHEADQK